MCISHATNTKLDLQKQFNYKRTADCKQIINFMMNNNKNLLKIMCITN